MSIRVRISRQALPRLFAAVLCASLIFSVLPVTLNRGRGQAQGNQAGGLRTTGAPSLNLPDLDAVRDKKELDHKMPAPEAAKRCRHWDRKCKEKKEKKALVEGGDELKGLIAMNGEFPANRAFDWRGDLFSPFSNLPGGFNRPVSDVVAGRSVEAARSDKAKDAEWARFEERKKRLPRAFANSLFPAAAAAFQYSNLETARVQPHYRTGQPGEDLLSGNFHWSMPIVSLPGRGGHDLNLTLSYNSLIWMKSGGAIRFDMDSGWPSPGFRFGFPIFYGPYVNSRTNRQSYIVVTPSGSAVEMRQVTGIETYDAEDGSYMRFKYDTATGNYILTTADGTQYIYGATLDIKDRNGNVITATYNVDGLMDTITDTVGRVIYLNYGSFYELQSITQLWNGIFRTIASFSYADQGLYYNFSGVVPDNVSYGLLVPVMYQLDLMGGTRYKFQYNTYGQVNKIERYGGNTFLRAWTSYNLPANQSSGAQTDCPRFTTRTDWAYEWSAVSGVATNYQFLQSIANPDTAEAATIPNLLYGQATTPDGTTYKELYYPDPAGTAKWRYGLLKMSQTWTDGNTINRKKTTLQYEQPCGGGTINNWLYQCNPRVAESNIYDNTDSNNSTWENRRRTTIAYAPAYSGTQDFNLPGDVYEYDSNATTVLRCTHTDYNQSSTYINRRIIGLPSARMLYNGAGALFSKVEYVYDEAAYFQTHSPTPIKLDTTVPSNARGNLTTMRRYNVNDNTTVENKTGYYHTGNPAFVKDALNHQATFSYTNAGMFINSTVANTYAYATAITDPDNFSSSVQYDYHNGGVAKTTNQKGASVLRQYDAYDRLFYVTNQANNAYTRYEFDANQYYVKSYSTIQDNAGEFYSITVFDGHDRPRATVSEHPGSAGQYQGAYNAYDTMGRLSQRSNPTEINSAWVPAGDDAVNGTQGGWRWSLQSYDWKSRPLVATDTLGKTTQVSYTGCGCAGGLSAVYTDEMGRKRKAIADALGREWKTQVLRSDGSVYSTVTNTYNIRDQITNVEEKDEASGVTQNTVMGYDGHGRLNSRKRPQETAATTFDYYADDRIQHSKDARNAEGTLVYNARGLLTSATYVTPGAVAATSSVTFQYDQSGMRTFMDDGPGAVTYQYNNLNQLTAEIRTFDAIAGKSFTLSYLYNLSGQTSAMTYTATNATSDTINYARDKAGRITGITGSPWGGVTSYASGIQYRAWGAPKAATYGSGFSASAKYNVRMQVSEFDIPGVIGGTYTYNDDRQLSTFVASTAQYTQYDTRMNRTFGYDQFGRMTSSVAGGSGFYATFNPQQDAFGNVTNSAYLYWQNGTTQTTFSASYLNNRATAVTDAGQAQTWNYDAMGNRTSMVKNGTTIESIGVDALGRGVSGGLDGEGQVVVLGGGGNYYVRSTVFGGEVVTMLDNLGNKTIGRVLDGANLIAEQIKPFNGPDTVRWHHRDPLNLVARDTEPGQIKRRVHAVTPNGAQIETSDGVNLPQYYSCLYGAPNCNSGYTQQIASTYGYLADQANGMAGAALKVDGALTLFSLNDLLRQLGRTGLGHVMVSPALGGTVVGRVGTTGSWQKKEVWTDLETEDETQITARDDSYYEWVPGGNGVEEQSVVVDIEVFVVSNVEKLIKEVASGSVSYLDNNRIAQCARLPLAWQNDQEDFITSRLNRSRRLSENWVPAASRLKYGMDIKPGTVVATFSQNNGRYAQLNAGQGGENHTAIFLEWVDHGGVKGMKVIQQLSDEDGRADFGFIYFDDRKRYSQNANRFSCVQVPTGK